MAKKFLIYSTYGEIVDVAIYLKHIEGHEVLMHIPDEGYKHIGDGLVDKIDTWWDCLGKDYTWMIDGCETAKFQDWLRARGEFVFGTSEKAALLEENRQVGQKLFKKMGFEQPESKNFKDIDEAISFVNDNLETRYILKQNGSAPKHLNHMGKFDGNEDMLFHLEELKREWSVPEYGPVDFDLMQVVEGCETAFSAFWNGHDWMRDKDGKAQIYMNWEEKKAFNGGLGKTCGESGTTFLGIDEDNDFSGILLNEELEGVLEQSGFRGVVDINGLFTDDGDYVAFEFSNRPGIPATSFEFIEGLETNTGDLIDAVARGLDIPIEIKKVWGQVLVFAAKPFPMESDNLDAKETSLGERLWPLKDGQPVKNFSKDQIKHIHFYNIQYDKKKNVYSVPTESGYILTVTATGDSVEDVREKLLEYTKENVYLPDQQWRTDLGVRMEEWSSENIA